MTDARPDGDLDQVRQGLRMAAPPDPGRLAAEREQLRELAQAPLGRRWLGYLRFIGPGYMQSAMTLGSGTAASSLFAGAAFGYSLLWVAPLGMLLGILVMGVVSHQTLSTGQRVLPAMATYAGKWLAWGFAIAAVLASIVWHFPQYNLAAGVLVDATATLGVEGLHPGFASAFVLVWAVVLSMSYGKSPRLVRVYESFLKYTVWGIVLSLAWVVANTATDWGAVLAGFVPSLPEDRLGIGIIEAYVVGNAETYWSAMVAGFEPHLPEDRDAISSIELVVSGIAAAVGINMLLLYPYSLQARGWGREHRGLARFDLFTGMLIPYALASGLLVIAAANTFYQPGEAIAKDTGVTKLARVLGDVIGPVSGRLLFDVGMLAMALSTITLHMIVCGFVAMEWFGLPFGSTRQRLFTLMPVPGVLAPFFWGDYAVWLAVPTTIICGAMLPIAYIGFLLLQRSRAYMGEDRPQGLRGFVATAGLVVAMGVIVTSLAFYLIKKLSG